MLHATGDADKQSDIRLIALKRSRRDRGRTGVSRTSFSNRNIPPLKAAPEKYGARNGIIRSVDNVTQYGARLDPEGGYDDGSFVRFVGVRHDWPEVWSEHDGTVVQLYSKPTSRPLSANTRRRTEALSRHRSVDTLRGYVRDAEI
jgi:hypothetical protein